MKESHRITILQKENHFLFAGTMIMFIILVWAIFYSLQIPLVEVKTPSTTEIGTINLQIPAVDTNGNGVVTQLSVKTEKGQGKTLIDINGLYFFLDTQESIKTAKQVASEFTNYNLDEYDITYTIYTDADSIGGPSAGAALTVATIASLQNLKLRDDVIMTGQILPDGTIGEVSSILKKAEAAERANAKLFLVPPNQAKEIVFGRERECTNEGTIEICNIETTEVEKDLNKEVGIEIIEVRTIQEVLEKFVV